MPPTYLQLEDIQGNVLRGYSHRFAAYVNARIDDAAQGRAFLSELAGRITCAVPEARDLRPATLNLAVSRAGLEHLGLAPSTLDDFPEEFLAGMAARAERLGDTGASAPCCWQDGLGPGDLQVLLIVHADAKPGLDGELAWITAAAERCGVPLDAPELGDLGARVDGPYTREHFGFKDGFGQPAVDGQPSPEYRGQGVPVAGSLRLGRRRPGWRMIAPGEFILGYRDEDGELAAADVPLLHNGTFMVFRKLRQDVARFRSLLDQLAREHFSGDADLAAAKLAGRWRDGTPLLPRPERPDSDLAEDKERTNDFRYAGDPQGRICPIGAHIRRANPRDALPGGAERTRRHRIIRRGMPYGAPLPEGVDDGGEGERGLLFACFNASIARQFEVVNGWLTRGDAFGIPDGDLLTDRTGRPRMTIDGSPPSFFRPEDGRPLVTTRGGEYLFLPSLRALADLARQG